jgi:hypothetical protein
MRVADGFVHGKHYDMRIFITGGTGYIGGALFGHWCGRPAIVKLWMIWGLSALKVTSRILCRCGGR